MTIRVVLADDQEMVRIGFGMILSAAEDIEVVGQCADGVEALETIRRLRPDVALLDIRMPRLDGLEVARQVLDPPGATGGPTTRVVIVTTFGDDDYVDRALDLGAAGFLLKDSGPALLLAAVRAAAQGTPSSVRSSPSASSSVGAGGAPTVPATPDSTSSPPARPR